VGSSRDVVVAFPQGRLPGAITRFFFVLGACRGFLAADCDSGGAVDSFLGLSLRCLRGAFLFLVGLTWWSVAIAETIPATRVTQALSAQTKWQYSGTTLCWVNPASGYIYDSSSAACAAVPQAILNAAANQWIGVCPGTRTGRAAPAVGTSCRMDVLNQSGAVDGSNVQATIAQSSVLQGCPSGWVQETGPICAQYSCPVTGGWTLSGTSCTRSECPGYRQYRDAAGACRCLQQTDRSGDEWSLTWTGSSFPGEPGPYCEGGCAFLLHWDALYGGRLYGHNYYTGSTCTGADTTPAPGDIPGQPAPTETPDVDETQRCRQQGLCHGTVNGVATCLPCSSLPEPTVRDPAGGPTTTTETTPGGPTVTTTETPVTRCTGAVCDTTTTTVIETCPPGVLPGSGTCTRATTVRNEPGDGPGGNGGSDTPDPFCVQNPTDPTCRRSAFAGTCAAVVCDGDAVVCAMAREQHKRNCELFDPAGTMTKAEAVAAFDSLRALPDVAGMTVTQAVGSVTGQVLYASALSDLVVVVKGETITVPFSSLVPYLQYAGLAFMIVCGILAVRIFSGVV